MNDTFNKIEALEGVLLSVPEIKCPTNHHFAAGVYLREVAVPEGKFILGHEHRFACLNILAKGRVKVFTGEESIEIEAPYIFRSEAGVRKAAITLTDIVWITVHATENTEVEVVETELFIQSKTFKERGPLALQNGNLAEATKCLP